MAKRIGNPLFSRLFKRTLKTMTRTVVRAGTKAVKQALTAKKTTRKPTPSKRLRVASSGPASGVTAGLAGLRRYRLFKPPGVLRSERLPLVVMLHGCAQDAREFAASTHMNQVAASQRFFVLYPEQDLLSNVQRCWRWFETRSGRARSEADSINAAIDQVCLKQAIDPGRIGLAGLSAGASMAALLAIGHPERFKAVAMHSGIAPGVAHSLASAISAMNGRKVMGTAIAPLPTGTHLPALLVIQGSADHLVAPSNGAEAARLWTVREEAKAVAPRTVQRGKRYSSAVTDYKTRGRLVATVCAVNGLGHAWSGGTAGHAFSDAKGPDASRMIWAFMAKQFLRPTLVSRPAV